MGEAALEVCADFLAGVAGACPLVGGAGSWPSSGLAMTRDISVGGYGLFSL